MAGKFLVERWTLNWTWNWTSNWTLNENVYAKINLWIKTQGYGSTVYPTSFSEFLGGVGGPGALGAGKKLLSQSKKSAGAFGAGKEKKLEQKKIRTKKKI